MAIVELIYDVKPLTYIAANPTKVLSNGEPIYYTNGQYSIGDGTTQLSSLPLYGGVSVSPAWGSITGTLSSQTDLQTVLNAKQNTITTGTTAQYLRGDLSLATFPTNVSSFTNDSGYITSSALSPYLTSATAASTYLTIANAASTYQPIGSYLTGLTVGSTAIGSGTNTRILYNNAGVLGEYAVTGTGTTAVLSNSPTFTATANPFSAMFNGDVIISNNLAKLYIGNDTVSPTSYALAQTAANEISLNTPVTGRIRAGGALCATWDSISFTINGTSGLILANNANDTKIFFNRTGGNIFSFQHDSSSLYLYNNTADKLIFRAFNGGYTIFDTPVASTGSNVQYQFTSANSTGHTAGANIPNFRLLSATKTWSAGALTNQYFVHLASQTIAFASASTAANVYGLYVEAATAGTNATITNNYAAGFGGNVICTGFFRSGTYIYAENDFRIAGAVVLDYSSTTLQVATSSFFQSLSLRTNGVTRLALSTTDLTFSDSYNLIFNATTGTKIGTATTQKLAFWNATPIVQPTTAVAAATFVANTSAIANDTATFDGYTIGQIVKALRNAGLLA